MKHNVQFSENEQTILQLINELQNLNKSQGDRFRHDMIPVKQLLIVEEYLNQSDLKINEIVAEAERLQ